MFKRICALIAVGVLALAFAGCSSGAQTESETSAAVAEASEAVTSEPVSTGESSSLLAPQEWPQNEITEGVPVPSFSGELETVSISDSLVQTNWAGVPEEEAAAYVEEVKAAGFTYSVHEMKSSDLYTYSAGNADNALNHTKVSITYRDDATLSLDVTRWDYQ